MSAHRYVGDDGIWRRANDEELLAAIDDGVQAAIDRKSFNEWCPYLFDRCQCSVDEYQFRIAPLRNQWFSGWKSQLDSEGLGFDFTPNRLKKE